jgi:hypothetical protein
LSQKIKTIQAWWYTPMIPTLGRLGQEDQEFKVSLNYILRPSLKKKKKKFPVMLVFENHFWRVYLMTIQN